MFEERESLSTTQSPPRVLGCSKFQLISASNLRNGNQVPVLIAASPWVAGIADDRGSILLTWTLKVNAKLGVCYVLKLDAFIFVND